MCKHIDAITHPDGHRPGKRVCIDCAQMRPPGTFVHLRRCQNDKQTRCCDSSPNQHARKHAESSGEQHQVIASAEQGEQWLYCYLDDETKDYQKHKSFGDLPRP